MIGCPDTQTDTQILKLTDGGNQDHETVCSMGGDGGDVGKFRHLGADARGRCGGRPSEEFNVRGLPRH